MSFSNTNFKYSSAFKEAMAFSFGELNSHLTPSLKIDAGWGAPLNYGLKFAASRLSDYFRNGNELAGNCFWATTLVSYEFTQAKIPHAITIGDVEFRDGGLYMSATRESLIMEIKKGFDPSFGSDGPTIPKNKAHAWITLPNCEVVDATILSDLMASDNEHINEPSDLKSWIFRSLISDRKEFRHIPLLTGLTYHLKAVTGIHDGLKIKEQFLDGYHDWADAYLSFMECYNS